MKGQDRRYILFKSTLFLSLKAKDFKYEDHLRSLFGKMVIIINFYLGIPIQYTRESIAWFS